MPHTAGKTRRVPDAPTPEYVLGTDEQELQRLGLQHRLWSAAAHEAWERARIQPGMTVLDIGCGPGHATLDLAEIVGPRGRVTGIDESPKFLKHLQDQADARRLTNVERILADAQHLETLKLPDASVDFAYARWVLCFVKDPEAIVRGVARILKPGGRFVVQDYFHYESMTIAPKRPSFTKVIDAVAKSWRERGGDPDIVGRLPAMFSAHGLAVDDLHVNRRLARPGTTMWHWPDSFWKSFLPRLVALGHLDQADERRFEADWAEATADPASFMLLPPVFDLIGRKG
jgi:ubiquinone/menaquinone biosynthesis C-methylase UbiE